MTVKTEVNAELRARVMSEQVRYYTWQQYARHPEHCYVIQLLAVCDDILIVFYAATVMSILSVSSCHTKS